MTIDCLLFLHKTLEAVRGLRATKISEHAICSCTFCPVYRDVTSGSNLPPYSHSKNLSSDFLFLGHLISRLLVHHSTAPRFSRKKCKCESKKCNFKDIRHCISLYATSKFWIPSLYLWLPKMLSHIHLNACHVFSSKSLRLHQSYQLSKISQIWGLKNSFLQFRGAKENCNSVKNAAKSRFRLWFFFS